MKETQAGGVTGGTVDVRVPDVPASISEERFGSPPSPIIGVMISNEALSIPIIKTFLILFYAIPFRRPTYSRASLSFLQP